MNIFTTKDVDGKSPSLSPDKSTSTLGAPFLEGDSGSSLVEVLIDNRQENGDWVKVRREVDIGVFEEGWMPRQHLDQPAAPLTVFPVDEAEFVQACAREELGGKAFGDPARGVQADYLIALAWIESKLQDFGPPNPQSDAVGPYQFTADRWDEIAAAENLTSFDRFGALSQITGASAIARRDYTAFSALARPDGDTATDGSYIPSFLNLFHAWLIGVPAAHEVDAANRDDPGLPIGPILAKHHPGASDDLMKGRAVFLQDAGQDGRVGGFVGRTTQALADALQKAGDLLKTHFPDFAIPGGGTAAPWMDVAESERHIWEVNKLVESDAEGAARVKTYFSKTEFAGTSVDPWCGAFIAFCLKESKNARAAASVVAGAARAANWKTWGDIELRSSIPDQLRRGAIAVLSPTKDTGRSGHVTFLTGTTAGPGRVFGLGGNQSDRVKISDYPISRIVAVRWLTLDDAAGGTAEVGSADTGMGDPGTATAQDILTMARTLYGEARGEIRLGIEAVACVILNRVKSSRFPKTITGVCLQPYQFSCWNKNDPNRAKIINLQPDADPQIKMCMDVAQKAEAGAVNDPTDGATHYHAVGIARPSWVTNSPGATSITIGRHIFYKGIR